MPGSLFKVFRQCWCPLIKSPENRWSSSCTRRGRLTDCADLAKRLEFSSATETVLTPNARKSLALQSCRTHPGREPPTPFTQIDPRQRGLGEVGVLLQAVISGYLA